MMPSRPWTGVARRAVALDRFRLGVAPIPTQFRMRGPGCYCCSTLTWLATSVPWLEVER
jgi:hypothetical protein